MAVILSHINKYGGSFGIRLFGGAVFLVSDDAVQVKFNFIHCLVDVVAHTVDILFEQRFDESVERETGNYDFEKLPKLQTQIHFAYCALTCSTEILAFINLL